MLLIELNFVVYCSCLIIISLTILTVHAEHGVDLKPLPDAVPDIFPDLVHTIDHLPEQVHLSLGNDEHSMVVLWSTYEEYDEGHSYVHYGLGTNNFTVKSQAKGEDLRNGNPLGCKGVYLGVMENLIPHKIYSYRVETAGHFSKNFTFRHLSSESNRSAKFLVYGDLGKTGGGFTVRRLIEEANTDNYDAVIHVGDFAYDFHTQGGKRGDEFMNRIQPIASKLAYMHCPGNHEIMYDFIHYRYRFASPASPWPIPKYKMWYSFDIGPVHFISYSTEVYFTDNQGYVSAQYTWLSQDLDAANRNRAIRPWIVAFGHRPMYCSNFNRDDCTKLVSSMRKEPYNLERLFYTKGVDLIVQGHEHSYERLYPLYADKQTDCSYHNPKAPVHIIAGSAGCNEREMVCADVILGKPHHWSAKRSWLPGLNGFGQLEAINRTHLRWHQIMAITDQPLDSFLLVQENHGPRSLEDVEEQRCAT